MTFTKINNIIIHHHHNHHHQQHHHTSSQLTLTFNKGSSSTIASLSAFEATTTTTSTPQLKLKLVYILGDFIYISTRNSVCNQSYKEKEIERGRGRGREREDKWIGIISITVFSNINILTLHCNMIITMFITITCFHLCCTHTSIMKYKITSN